MVELQKDKIEGYVSNTRVLFQRDLRPIEQNNYAGINADDLDVVMWLTGEPRIGSPHIAVKPLFRVLLYAFAYKSTLIKEHLFLPLHCSVNWLAGH